MSKLPQLSGQTIVKALSKIGYRVVRQRGSHMRLRNDSTSSKPVTVPDYKVVSKGLLRKILRDAQLSVEKFLKLL